MVFKHIFAINNIYLTASDANVLVNKNIITISF
jgi:hypothetical protein